MESSSWVASASSAVVVAGVSELGILENLPKGALIAAVVTLFAAVGFFAKRDYKRIDGSIDGLKERLTRENAEIKERLAQIDIRMANLVDVKAIGSNNAHMHDKINRLGQRVTYLQASIGLPLDLDNDKGPENAG